MEKEYDMTVKNIPSGLFTCLMDGNEVGIEEFSPAHIVFRFSKKQGANCTKVQFAYFVLEKGQYDELVVENLTLVDESELNYCFLYTYEIHNKLYEQMIYFIVKQYEQYIQLKLESYDNSFSEKLVGYPSIRDEEFAKDATAWEKSRIQRYQYEIEDLLRNRIQRHHLELAYVLEKREKYGSFLSDGWTDESVLGKITRIYIGNAWCPHLFPEHSLLMKLVDLVKQRSLGLTIVLPFLQEEWIPKWEMLLKLLYEWACRNDMKVEIVVNDYGELLMLRQMQDHFQISLGVLLNKRRRDPRYPYKAGFTKHQNLLRDNAIQSEEYMDFLVKNHCSRIETQGCGFEMNLTNEKQLPSTLQLPLYQTNTSQYCPIYAICKNKDRGKQEYIQKCPHHCEKYVCLYPEHLSLIGKYNSIFAFDEWTMTHVEVIDTYVQQGMDRILWNL